MYAESCVEHNKDLEELVRLIKLDYSLIEREALKLYCEIVQFLKMDDLIRPLWFSLAAFYHITSKGKATVSLLTLCCPYVAFSCPVTKLFRVLFR